MTELDELKHDIAEYVKISSEMASEIVSQKAEIERLKEYEDAVYAHFDVACHSYDANKSVYENLSMLQSWHCDIALDPKVSKPANELHSEIERLKGQRDRLLDAIKLITPQISAKAKRARTSQQEILLLQLIAEIEAEK